LQLGVPLQAERALLFVLERKPDHLGAHRDLAALYYDQWALMRAVKHCEDWARLSPRDGRPLRFMGYIYRHLELHEDAVSSYRAALRLELDDTMRQLVRVELAESLIQRGEFKEALETLQECQPPALQKVPADVVKAAIDSFLARKWTLTAECRRGMGQGAEALNSLAKAFAADADFPDALRLRANMHLDAGEFQAAAQLLDRGLPVNNHDFAALDRRAQAYAGLGKTAEAERQRVRLKETQKLLQDLKKANEDVQASPRDGALHARLAEIYEKL